MYYTYVLLSIKDNKLYIGYTSNLRKRIEDHNTGKNVSTKHRRPLKLIFYEAYLERSDAERRERYFKTYHGKATLRIMLKDYFAKVLYMPIITHAN